MCNRCSRKHEDLDAGDLCESCKSILREYGYEGADGAQRFELWADGRQFFAAQRSLRMDQLRFLVGAPADRSCVQELPPDLVPIHDDQSVDLTQQPRFLFLPNAHY